MEPEEYIIQRLKGLAEKENLSAPQTEDELISLIFKLLMSKKFRKYAVSPPEYLDHIHSAIKQSVDKNEPIKLTLVFGGYKLWRLKESPEVDWAELFSLIYYARWLKPICQIYKPGVWFDFFSDDVILEIMNNIPEKDTATYNKSFRNLLEFIKSYLPSNMLFTLNRVGDQYDSYEHFEKELGQSIEKVREESNGLPKLNHEQIALVELNVKLEPGQSNDPKWREKVFLTHEGYARISKRRPYYRTDDKIFVITRPIEKSIAVGTTKTSVVKFWIGAGVLEKRDNSFVEYIFSPRQLESSKFKIEQVSIDGLNSKNFNSIRILENF